MDFWEALEQASSNARMEESYRRAGWAPKSMFVDDIMEWERKNGVRFLGFEHGDGYMGVRCEPLVKP